jgi:hypothetical protein
MTKEAQSPNDEELTLRSFTISSFVIPSCFGIRHSSLIEEIPRQRLGVSTNELS